AWFCTTRTASRLLRADGRIRFAIPPLHAAWSIRSVEVDSGINVDQRQINAQRRNADRGIRARQHLRSGWKLLLTAAVVGPSLDLILGKDEVGRQAGKLQII